MWRSVSIRQLALAEQMAKALELFNLQRTKELELLELFSLQRTREFELLELLLTRDHDARAKELQQWTSLLQAVFRTQEQAFTSNIDSLGMGDDDGAVDLRRGDHGEHGDREAMGSERTIREADSPALRAPPGLQPSEPHHWIPRSAWMTLGEKEKEFAYHAGRRLRQQRRRARQSSRKRRALAANPR